ncbi:hypothetical protein HDK77DRAFT_108222 [Phyllosticta capitalensis]
MKPGHRPHRIGTRDYCRLLCLTSTASLCSAASPNVEPRFLYSLLLASPPLPLYTQEEDRNANSTLNPELSLIAATVPYFPASFPLTTNFISLFSPFPLPPTSQTKPNQTKP